MTAKIGIGLMELPVITYQDEDMYVSEVPVFSIASQGKTVEESILNLKEAVELYFEDEDLGKILADKFPQLPNSVLTTSMTFNTENKKVVKLPIAQT